MTQNQIEYWKLQETLRHNQAVESETERAARATLRETKRSNLAREAETKRSNVSNESIALAQAGVGMERNEIEREKAHNAYNASMLDYYLKGNYNDRYFDLANRQLAADINRANLQYKSSIYSTDANRLVGLTNAQYNREVGLVKAANDLVLGTEQNRINKTKADNEFILGASRNAEQRRYNDKSLGLESRGLDIREEEVGSRWFGAGTNALVGVGKLIAAS